MNLNRRKFFSFAAGTAAVAATAEAGKIANEPTQFTEVVLPPGVEEPPVERPYVGEGHHDQPFGHMTWIEIATRSMRMCGAIRPNESLAQSDVMHCVSIGNAILHSDWLAEIQGRTFFENEQRFIVELAKQIAPLYNISDDRLPPMLRSAKPEAMKILDLPEKIEGLHQFGRPAVCPHGVLGVRDLPRRPGDADATGGPATEQSRAF